MIDSGVIYESAVTSLSKAAASPCTLKESRSLCISYSLRLALCLSLQGRSLKVARAIVKVHQISRAAAFSRCNFPERRATKWSKSIFVRHSYKYMSVSAMLFAYMCIFSNILGGLVCSHLRLFI